MKKIIFAFALAMCMCSTIKAQVFVGGGGLIGYNQDAFKFEAKPTLGYKLSDKFAVAIEGGFGVVDTEIFGILDPYLRYTFWSNGKVAIDGKLKGEMMFSHEELSAAEVGIAPSFRVKLNPKWELSADLGIFGAQMLSSDNWEPAFGVTTSGIEIAFLYNF